MQVSPVGVFDTGKFIKKMGLVIANNSEETEEKPAICLTPECVLASAEILQNLSPRYQDINPCTNFDQYVCEGFNEKHDLRPDQGRVFTGTIMAERGEQILKHLLEAPYAEMEAMMTMESADNEIFRKLQNAYSACLNERKLENIRSAPLIDVLREIEQRFPAKGGNVELGGGPSQPRKQQSLKSRDSAEAYLSDVVTYMASIGVTSLIDVGVGADDRDPDVVVPFVNAPRSPGLPSKEYYEDEEILSKYGEVIGKVLEGLLKEANSSSLVIRPEILTRSAQLVERIVSFEHSLAKATPATEEAEDVTFYYNPMTFQEAETLLPQIPIEHTVKTFAPHAPRPPKIIVGAPVYLEAVAKVLEETSAETLQAYFVWKTVQAYASKVEDEAVTPLKRFNNEMQGKDPDATPERWRTCVQVADNSLGWILSRFFVQKAFSEEARIFGDKIVSDIKEQFVKKLQKAEWMSEEVRRLGIEKGETKFLTALSASGKKSRDFVKRITCICKILCSTIFAS